MKKVFCPECGCLMSEYGPAQNDLEGPLIKRIKMKCETCSSFGRVWEAKIENGVVTEIKFVRVLFHDSDHR